MAFPSPRCWRAAENPQEWRRNFPTPCLCSCLLTGPQLDRLLGAMKRAKLPPIPLKAVLTPTNRDWTSQQLWQELRREHQAMQERQGK